MIWLVTLYPTDRKASVAGLALVLYLDIEILKVSITDAIDGILVGLQ